MNKEKIIEKIENFEFHHKVFFFIFIFIITIIYLRISTNIYNPNPIFFGFEFHHFDYGLIILILTSILLIFNPGKKRNLLYLFLISLSIGLIIDDLWFIRSIVSDPLSDEMIIYNATFSPSLLLAILLILIVLSINYFKNKE